MPQPYLKTKIYSIYKPSLGLIKNEPTSILNPRASIDCQNVRYYNGIVAKRTGYQDYGTGTITGVPIKFDVYTKEDGTEYHMLATTTNIYKHTKAAGTWTSIASTIGCDIDNRISFATVYDSDKFYCVFGSKDYLVKKWDGVSVTALASDVSTWKPKIIVPFQYRLLMFNIDVNGTDKPIRMSYCAANDIDDWTTASVTGSRNLIQGMGSEILNAVPIKGWLGVYKDRSITLVSYVGGDSIFANRVAVDGIGLLAQDAIVNLGTKHLFWGNDYNIYQWDGGGELIPIGDPIVSDIREYSGGIDRANLKRCFAVANFENTEAHFFMPVSGSGDSYCTVFYTYNWVDKTWAKNTIASTSGAGKISDDGTERTLFGMTNGGVERYDYGNDTDDGVAIDSYFTTPDIVIDAEEYKVKRKGFRNVYVDAFGHTLSMYYSTDEGVTWSTVDTDTLHSNSVYNLHPFNFTDSARTIRFKFANSMTHQWYSIRYIGIEYKERERK